MEEENRDGAEEELRQVERRHVSVHFDCSCTDEDLARIARELREDPRLLDGYGGQCCPPLLHAVIKEHPRCVAFLLECGAEVNQEYETLGESALSCSVTRSTPDIAHMLLASDASGINVKSSLTHETPLVKAVKHGNAQTVRLLLEHGARPNSGTERNDDVIPCVYLAVELGHQSIVTDLLAHGATLTGHSHFDKHNVLYKHMQFAIAEGQLETVRSLCLYGALKELCKITLYPELSTVIHCNFTLLGIIFRNENSLEVNVRMLNILYEFGFNFWKCDKHDKNAWKKMEKLQTNEFTKLLIYRIFRLRSRPMQLKQLCRIKLLNFFEHKFLKSVPQLLIPNELKDYLRFSDVN
ncbi:ankyrin repeat and KH domain-containing protein 1-like [Neocloeon triangulifer]|uniref:ankyrin repeat and KH domain-containing protein 1-like n=1 Tax=Neocloeon triangulifer TaxID=2078957 RepID=UPI00286ECEFD|nr:ankyrin repeat and KH domain-containing protein 1-like [Neocloeon triangulifer]